MSYIWLVSPFRKKKKKKTNKHTNKHIANHQIFLKAAKQRINISEEIEER